ncbi:MAG: hypothetical protein ACR2M1_14825 [Gemmatimonadaceae bacterium]
MRSLLRATLAALCATATFSNTGAAQALSRSGPQAPVLLHAAERVSWSPIVKYGGNVFPSYVIATAGVQRWNGIDRFRHAVPNDTSSLVGDMLGNIGVRVQLRRRARVRIEVEAPDIAELSSLNAVIEPGQEVDLFPRIRYRYAALASVYQPRSVGVVVRLFVDDDLVTEYPSSLKVMALTDVPFQLLSPDGLWQKSTWMFAAMADENAAVVGDIIADAVDGGVIQYFDGYDGDSASVHSQVYAVWNVLQRRGLTYSSISAASAESPFAATQTVRTVTQTVMADRANCVDASVLFAAALRRIGLDPILVLSPTHMFLGFYLNREHTQISFLETTLLGSVDITKLPEDGTPEADSASLAGGQSRDAASFNSFLAATNFATRRFQTIVAPALAAQARGYEIIDIGRERARGIRPVTDRYPAR